MTAHEQADVIIQQYRERLAKLYRSRQKGIEAAVFAFLKKQESKDAALKKRYERGEISIDEYKQKRLLNIVTDINYRKFLQTVGEEIAAAAVEGEYMTEEAKQQAAQIAFDEEKSKVSDKTALAALAFVSMVLARRKFVKDREAKYISNALHSIAIQLTLSPVAELNYKKFVDDTVRKATQQAIQTSYKGAVARMVTKITYGENLGRQAVYNVLYAFGVKTHKIWRTQGDERVRESHEAAEGQTVPIDEPFIIGGYEMMFPGDFTRGAPASQYYRCRCWMESD